MLATALHERGHLPAELTPNEAAGWDSEYPYQAGKFDYYGYSIQIVGEYPDYSGTVIMYHGRNGQAPVTLTVKDISAKEWEIVREPIPDWWEIWK